MNLRISCLVDDLSSFGLLEGSGKLLDYGALGQWLCTMIILGCILVVRPGSIHKMALFGESRLSKEKS